MYASYGYSWMHNAHAHSKIDSSIVCSMHIETPADFIKWSCNQNIMITYVANSLFVVQGVQICWNYQLNERKTIDEKYGETDLFEEEI